MGDNDEQKKAFEVKAEIEKNLGKIKERKHVLFAQANIKKTWKDLLNLPNVIDKDKPIEVWNNKYQSINGGLWDPTS